MFGVFYHYGDGCTFSAETLLFVTADLHLAQDSVTLAELEHEQAMAVPRVAFSMRDVVDGKISYEQIEKAREDYEATLRATLTTHPDRFDDLNSEEGSYSYRAVEVR